MNITARLFRRRSGSGSAVSCYVFIVTYARSGSSLLQKILNSIPGSHISGENGDALGGLFTSWRKVIQAKQDEGGSRRNAPGDPWRGIHLIDAQDYNRRLIQVFVEEILRPPQDARLVGFKEVRYFDYGEDLPAYLDYIQSSFTPILLVFNRRRGRDVAKSAWWKDHPADIAGDVKRFDAMTDAYCVAHPDETIVVDYDQWSRDPELLRPLFERLLAPFDRKAIDRILSARLNH